MKMHGQGGIYRGVFGAALVTTVSLVVLGSGHDAASAGEAPSIEEMWRLVQLQQRQIRQQSAQIRALTKTRPMAAARRRAAGPMPPTGAKYPVSRASTGDQVVRGVTVDVNNIDAGSGLDGTGSLSGGAGWWQRTSLGGYGEMHYNGGSKDEIDLHRFVLFVGHEFNDWIRLFSEIEIEHAFAKDTADGSGKGEVEIEQAYLQLDITDRLRANFGVQIVPVGILNETHEPPTFFGVERNDVEKNIIPATWWEAAAGVHGYLGASGFSYDLMVHSGLQVPTMGGSAFKPRSGRRKVAEAPANDPALTGRLKWRGGGVELAASLQHQFDVTQNDGAGNRNLDATLFTAHIDAKRPINDTISLALRALYAGWWFDGAAPKAIGRDEQYGWYVEPAVIFSGSIGDIGLFGRVSQWDNEAGDNMSSRFRRYMAGINYWPHPDVVFKVDVQDDHHDDRSKRDDRLNVGIGFQF